MYYNRKKLMVSIVWILTGAVLLVLEITGKTDSPICSGMGGGLLVIGIMQLCRNIRYHTDKEYREKTDIAWKDERNSYIRMKAWSWAGYLFILGSAVVSIVLFVRKMTQTGQIVSYCMCAVLLLYWTAWMILQKKY